MRVISVILLFLVGARAAFAVTAPPPEVNRVLSTFDFEERRLGNDEELPMYWEKVEGAAFPHYVNGRLSSDRAHSGRYSFRFDLNGGSLIYRYPAGRIRVQSGSHYRIEAAEYGITPPQWIVLDDIFLISSTEVWTDPQPATRPKRFYRAILIP